MPLAPLPAWAQSQAQDTTQDRAQIVLSAQSQTQARSQTQAEEQIFPWTCRSLPKAPADGPLMTFRPVVPHRELQGEWISSLEPRRLLDIREEHFSLQGTGRNLRGTIQEEGPQLTLTLEDGTQCRVHWQLLGDGRLALNSGQDLLHRRGEPALPTTTVRTFGNEQCRFTVTLPGVLPMEEAEDGVRIYSVERDAAMQILSGVTSKSAHDFAKAIATQLGSTDFKPVDNEQNAYTFTATVHNIPILQYIVKEGKQYLHISLMGQYNKLVSYLKYVKIVPPKDQ
ncbi:MAG TPA: hypothetical protein H9894_10605 [Candidatus Desulfovibrio intestinipullorum]|uniref:Uncharacterized protein n=1 Tax=Candidatus Desulfovibrio intestinipullorum TaxID=2838536 RepID=A0A9D1PXJ5_9BACT|nr:hypothetical protein [Candidatus Desulfovibrio intestinipullorum]